MKKLKITILSALAFVAVSFGFAFAPMTAFADEPATSAVESVETPEKSVETGENSADSTTGEEVVDSAETGENSAVLEGGANTFENFLAWTEKEAERYGHGDLYKDALESIKTAATTRQVTLSTLSSLAIVVCLIAYILYKKITDKKFRQQVAILILSYQELVQKLNELVAGTNENTKTEQEIKKEEAELKSEMKKTTEALACLIGGFMHFAEGIALKDTKKAEVQRDCINGLKKIDGEVVVDESNKK